MADREARLRRAAKKSLILRTNSRECICETLRFIYDLIHDSSDKELKEKITEYLLDAFMMAKKLQNRLLYYKETYNDEVGHSGIYLNKLGGSIARRKLRKNRII